MMLAMLAVMLGWVAIVLGIWALLYAHGDREREADAR